MKYTVVAFKEEWWQRPPEDRNTLYCYFCGRSQHNVALLIIGRSPSAVCDRCVDICAKMVLDRRRGIEDQLDEIRLLGT